MIHIFEDESLNPEPRQTNEFVFRTLSIECDRYTDLPSCRGGIDIPNLLTSLSLSFCFATMLSQRKKIHDRRYNL